jgi:hypothetical protein
MSELNFDKFLADQVERENKKTEASALAEKIDRFVYSELRAQNVPCIIDDDLDVCGELIAGFKTEILPEVRAHYLEQEPELLELGDEFDVLVNNHIDLITRARVQKELLMILKVKMSLALYGQDPDLDEDKASAFKKSQIADFMVNQGYEFDDPWVRFYDNITPGSGLDPNNEADQQYITDAIFQLAEGSVRTKEVSDMLHTAYSIAGIDTDNVNNENSDSISIKIRTVAKAMNYVVEMNIVKDGDNRSAERESNIYEIMREADFDDATIKDLVEFIELKFPLNLPEQL